MTDYGTGQGALGRYVIEKADTEATTPDVADVRQLHVTNVDTNNF
jgi:hypothetical protein